MDTENPATPTWEAQSDEELLQKYHELDEESAEFATVKEELTRRGFSFVPETEETEAEFEPVPEPLPQKPVFSKIGSLIWEIAYPVLALAGIGYFLSVLTNHGEKVSGKLAIYSAIVFLLLSSCGMMIGAMRRLTNSVADKSARVPGLLYYTWAWLWALTTAGAIYYLADTFIKTAKLSVEYAFFTSLIPFIGAMISLAFTFLFFSFWKASTK